MSNYTLAVIFSFSIAIAAIIGGVRFNRISPAYRPFLFCIWLAFANEILGFFIRRSGNSNAINNNIYVLAEAILVSWQFYRWRLFKGQRKIFIAILSSFLVFWIIECLVTGRIHYTTTYFRVYYSFVIVLMSINIRIEPLNTERRNILTNPVFLLRTGFLLYFTYKVIVQIFWLYGLGSSKEFRMNVVWILIYINLVTNLIYALAVLCMPRKQRFSLPY